MRQSLDHSGDHRQPFPGYSRAVLVHHPYLPSSLAKAVAPKRALTVLGAACCLLLLPSHALQHGVPRLRGCLVLPYSSNDKALKIGSRWIAHCSSRCLRTEAHLLSLLSHPSARESRIPLGRTLCQASRLWGFSWVL